MVEVSFKPWQKVVIHEAIEYEIKDFVKSRIIGLREGSMGQPLLWAEGVVFNRTVMPPTDDIVKEQLQGIIHFSAVEWAIMPQYRTVLKSEGITIPVIDVSNNAILEDVAKELKKQHKKS